MQFDRFIKFTDKVLFDGTQEQYNNEKGYRRFFVCSYATKDVLNELFILCENFAFIWHDKDINEDGTPKMPHCHFIVCYKNQCAVQTFLTKVARLVGNEQTVVSILGDKYAAISYMLHTDPNSRKQGKTLYERDNIFTDNQSFFFKEVAEQEAEKSRVEFIEDLCDGQLTYKQMALKYGRDYCKNYEKYHQFAFAVNSQEYENKISERRKDLVRESIDSGDLVNIVIECLNAFATRIKNFGIVPSRQQIQNYLDEILNTKQKEI